MYDRRAAIEKNVIRRSKCTVSRHTSTAKSQWQDERAIIADVVLIGCD